jgi:hypothetical protein
MNIGPLYSLDSQEKNKRRKEREKRKRKRKKKKKKRRKKSPRKRKEGRARRKDIAKEQLTQALDVTRQPLLQVTVICTVKTNKLPFLTVQAHSKYIRGTYLRLSPLFPMSFPFLEWQSNGTTFMNTHPQTLATTTRDRGT